MYSEGSVARLNPATGAELERRAFALPVEGAVCGLATGPDGGVFLSVAGNPELLAVRMASGSAARIVPAAEFAASPCELVIARRR